MAGLTQLQMHDEVLQALADLANAFWTHDQIYYSIGMAVADLSRMLPDQKVMDYTVTYTITDESVTLVGGTKTLTYQFVKAESETVTNAAGTTTYTRDTDYTMDYANGSITYISTGSIGATDTLLVDYTRSRIVVPLSTITGFKRVLRCEYPVSQVPQKTVDFSLWGDYLFIGAGYESQERMTDKKHVHVFYTCEHTAPGAAAGTYAEYLDEVVIMGAIAHALFIRGTELFNASDADLTDADTALDKVATLNVADGDIDSSLDGAHTHLTNGAAFLNTVNVGESVAANYAGYCGAEVEIARERAGTRDSYIMEARARIESGSQRLVIADRLLNLAKEKYADFWAVLNDRVQVREQADYASARQPA